MPTVRAGEIEIAYELQGRGKPLLLIMGIGAQLVLWPDELIERFVSRGFQVLRFDHRDVGKSTWLPQLGRPDIVRLLGRAALGLPVKAPYDLADMARDITGLMDAVGWPQAHVVGVSMGGMLAQQLAIDAPARVTSLSSLMSTPGERLVSLPSPRALQALFAPRAQNLAQAEEWFIHFTQVVGGPAYPVDPQRVREIARRSYERGTNPDGFLRHFAAILAGGDRTAALRRLQVPALVMHGTADPLVPLRAGRATAQAIPGARLREIEGWGHSLPPGVWDLLVDEIARFIDG